MFQRRPNSEPLLDLFNLQLQESEPETVVGFTFLFFALRSQHLGKTDVRHKLKPAI